MNTDQTLEILIVDDEIDLCFLLKNMLKKLVDSKVDVCHSVIEAISKLKTKRYDLAFFDYQLSDGLGLELVEFSTNESDHSPYIVAMSANVNSIEIDNLLKKGANQFVNKPLSKEKINHCLETFLS